MIFNIGANSGGTKLNFTIKTCASEDAIPEVSKDNTIYIVTDVDVTSYAFASTEPQSPENGMVWINTGEATDYELNILKKNSVIVNLGETKQYIDGAWVDVTALIYQNGELTTFASVPSFILLYESGNQCKDVTGGWTTSGYTFGSYPLQSGAVNNKMWLYASYGNPGAVYSIVGTVNKIDMSNINTLKANITITNNSGAVRMSIVSGKDIEEANKSSNMVYEYDSSVGYKNHTLKIDVSSYDGEYYIAIYSYGSDAYGHDPVVEIKKVWGE